MSRCPRCHQPVSAEAVPCPHCTLTLKAHGHPGIPLHRATGVVSLCHDCLYHHDDTCTFPQRPTAVTCTLYVSQNASPADAPPRRAPRRWTGRTRPWLLLGLLLIISLVVALVR